MRLETFKTLRESQSSQFFAWKGFSAKIGKQRGFKSAKAKWWGNKDADYVSAWKFKKGGAGKYRTLENLVSTDKCFSDIDSELPLTWQEIIALCVKYNVPKPCLIPKTSPNHYQPRWSIPEIDTSLLGMWQEVQDGIYEMFKGIGADPQAKEPTRYLRNPNKCEVVYSNELNKTTLSVLYRSLKLAGFIKNKPKPKWQTKFSPDYKPMRDSRERLETFLENNLEYESTYKALSETLSIPLRTVKYLVTQLKRDNRLETQVLGKGKNRKTRFIFKVHIKESFNSVGSNISDSDFNKPSNSILSQALVRAKAGGLVFKSRNTGFFCLAVWLTMSERLSYDAIFRELFSVLIVTPNFSRREFERTLKSGCSGKYKGIRINDERTQKFLVSLGLGSVH